MAIATSSGSLVSWPACIQKEHVRTRHASGPVCLGGRSSMSPPLTAERSFSSLSSRAAIVAPHSKQFCNSKSSFPRSRRRRVAVQADAKMFVPGFGEKSPEAKAADSLHNFFTFTALKIVLSQLQSYNPDAYKDLRAFAERVPLKDGDDFLHQLMRQSPQHKTMAMRILEVRSAYASEDFEWDNLQKLSKKRMDDSNTKVLREFLQQSSGIN